jgi:YVTN family beta-propeller protein
MKIASAVLLLVAVLMAARPMLPVIQATLTMQQHRGLGIDVATRKVVSNYNDARSRQRRPLAVLTVPAGTHPRRLIVNSASNLVYVVNDNAPGTVTVVETGSYGIVATIPVGNNPRTLGADFGAREIYVANHTGNSVSIIDTATNAVLATVPVGNGPRSPVANSGLGKVYVPNYNDASVSVIDTVTRTVTRRSRSAAGRNMPPSTPPRQGLRQQRGRQTISVIDSATDSVIQTSVGSRQRRQLRHRQPRVRPLLLANSVDNTVTIVDTDTDGRRTVRSGQADPDPDRPERRQRLRRQPGQPFGQRARCDDRAVLTSYAVGTGPWRP